MGRSMCVHVFGTYFGLSTSFALRLENTDGVLNRPNYCSNMTAIIGKNIMYSPFECNIIPISYYQRRASTKCRELRNKKNYKSNLLRP